MKQNMSAIVLLEEMSSFFTKGMHSVSGTAKAVATGVTDGMRL